MVLRIPPLHTLAATKNLSRCSRSVSRTATGHRPCLDRSFSLYSTRPAEAVLLVLRRKAKPRNLLSSLNDRINLLLRRPNTNEVRVYRRCLQRSQPASIRQGEFLIHWACKEHGRTAGRVETDTPVCRPLLMHHPNRPNRHRRQARFEDP